LVDDAPFAHDERVRSLQALCRRGVPQAVLDEAEREVVAT
jgi:hypothetical protein